WGGSFGLGALALVWYSGAMGPPRSLPLPSCGMAAGCAGQVPPHGNWFLGSLEGLASPQAKWTRGLAVRPVGVAGVGGHHRRRRAQHIGVVTFVRCGDLVLHLALARHMWPVAEHGHAPAGPHADQDVRLVVNVLAAIALHRELSSRSAPWQSAAWSRFRRTNKQLISAPPVPLGWPRRAPGQSSHGSGTAAPSPEFNVKGRKNASMEA